MYVSKEKNGELPGYNYFEKIASTWSRAKVKTVKDAIEYIEKKKHIVVEEKPHKSSKKKAVTPDWYIEYEKNLQKNEVNQEPVSEELANMTKSLFED
jgi:replication initiation and membrane attachment protein